MAPLRYPRNLQPAHSRSPAPSPRQTGVIACATSSPTFPGLKVGHAEDLRLGSGATAVIFDAPAVASIDVRGGGPGTRETALLDPAQTVEGIDAITLAGGSAFGLDAASGVQAWLREQGRGFAVRSARVPIVPAAILFDLLSGGDKDWGRYPPYRELGYAAAAATAASISRSAASAPAPAPPPSICKGGIGSASAQTAGRHHRRRARGSEPRRQRADRSRPVVLGGALRAATANSAAADFPPHSRQHALEPRTKGSARENTTLVVVATDAILTKAQAKRLAVMAQSGLSRAIYPGALSARR